MSNFDQIKPLQDKIDTLLLDIKDVKPNLFREYTLIVDYSINGFVDLGAEYIKNNPQEFEIFLKKLNDIIKILEFIKTKENINEEIYNMKITQIKQIIKEEIQNILKESHQPGDKVIYGGLGTVTIDKEENGLIYFTDKKGNKYKKNYAQFKQVTQPFQSPIYNPLHEGDKDVYIRGIKGIVSRYGKKAQAYVNNQLDGRELRHLNDDEVMKLNIDLQKYVSSLQPPKQTDSKTNFDPYLLGKGKGHLGSTYTGD